MKRIFVKYSKRVAIAGIVLIFFIGMIQSASAATWKQIINAHLTNFDQYGTIEEVDVQGNYAYVADWNLPGLRILSVANPANIFQVGICITNGNPYRVEVSGNIAYLRTMTTSGNVQNWWIEYIDITTAASPIRKGNFTYSGVNDFDVLGNYIYFSNTSLLVCMDMTNVNSPIETDTLVVENITSVCVNGTKAYVATSSDSSNKQLQIINCADVNNLALMGSCQIGNFWPITIKIDENYAYLAGRDLDKPSPTGGTFKSVDVANPNMPNLVCSLVTGGICCVGIEIISNIAITGACAQGLMFIDISQPTLLHPIGQYIEYQSICGGAHYAQYPVSYDDDVYGLVIFFASMGCGLNAMKADNLQFELDIPGYEIPVIVVILVSSIGMMYFKIKKSAKYSN